MTRIANLFGTSYLVVHNDWSPLRGQKARPKIFFSLTGNVTKLSKVSFSIALKTRGHKGKKIHSIPTKSVHFWICRVLRYFSGNVAKLSPIRFQWYENKLNP